MVKDYFREYYHLLWLEKDLSDKITEKQELLYSVHGIRYSDTPKVVGSNKNTLDKIEEIYDMKSRLLDIKSSLDELKYNLLSDIRHATSTHEKEEVLILRYMERMTICDTAKSLKYSERHIIRIIKEAEKELEKYIKERCQ